MGIETAILGSAVIGGLASRSAAKSQENASNNALNLQRDQYNQSLELSKPYRDAGANALGSIQAGIAPGGEFSQKFGDTQFYGDPGYQFRFDQGQRAIDSSAAARGGLQSGAALKAAARYGQGFASNEYNNAYNRFMTDQNTRFGRLQSVAGMGQAAAAGQAANGQNFANSGSNLMTGIGNAQASGTVGMANALSNGVGSYLNYDQNQQLLNSLRGSSYGSNPSAVNPYTHGANGP